MVFSAVGYIWVLDMKSDSMRRLTTSSSFEFMPAISPDGAAVAYIDFPTEDGHDGGRLVIAATASGAVTGTLAQKDWIYLQPGWSADGKSIALIREARGTHGSNADFGWTSACQPEFKAVAPAPASNDYLCSHIGARFVSFDAKGDHLLYSYPAAHEQIVLKSTELSTGKVRTLAIGSADVGGIVPAPDLKNVLLTRGDGTVWVAPLPITDNPVTLSTSRATRLSATGGYYCTWTHSGQAMFGYGSQVFRYLLDQDSAARTHIRLAYSRKENQELIALTGARVITFSQGDDIPDVIESATVVLDGRMILAVGKAADVAIHESARVLDMSGKTILPGLLDTHYHRIGGDSLSGLKLPNPALGDRSALAYGITTAWEPGGPADDGAPATADLREAGRILGPRWSYAASGAVGSPWEFLNSYQDALDAVERHKMLGVNVLKEYDTPSRQQQQWLSRAARAAGLRIVSHIESFDQIMTRALDGYTGGDHAYIPLPFFEDVAEVLRQTGYIWTPNIAISGGSVGREPLRTYFWQEVARRWPGQIDKIKAIAPAYAIDDELAFEPSVPFETHRMGRLSQQIAKARSSGVRIAVSAHNMPGALLHCEMWYMWRGGMTAHQVLYAATMQNAKKIGLDQEIGSLEPGKIADLVVLNGNPLEDILNTLTIEYTVQGGVIYDAASIGVRVS
jgi:hypothetical protein